MKVSIITAVLNRRDEIGYSLKSLMNQTYKNIQHVIIDGKSVDGTLDVLKNYKNSVKDYEIILVSEKDNGLYEALNKGLKLCTGDIIGVLHAGDMFAYKELLEEVVSLLKKYNVDGIYGEAEFINDNGNIIRKTRTGILSIKKVRYGWHPIHTTLFLRSQVYKHMGLYKEDFEIASDYEFMLRIFLKGKYRLLYLPKVLVKMKAGGKSGHTPKKLIKKLKEDWKIIREYKLPFYGIVLKRLYKIPEFLKLSLEAKNV
ncbi:MAG: glycosyltransferase [Aquificae bacterium]|nr:glycosyltransferase [Aquificota bacterium]